jgi:two-component system chemotaxis response regulator CheY
MTDSDPAADPRFLVVDDFATMRRVLRGLLRESGWNRVEEAGDAAAALARLKAERFDFVICDISMPTMSGLELLKAIRAVPALRELPVLMLTAEARRQEILLAAQHGAVGTIVKPFGRELLEAQIRRGFLTSKATA